MTSAKSNSSNHKDKSFTFILIPWAQNKPIQTIELEYPSTPTGGVIGGDLVPQHLKSFSDENIYQIEATPLKRMSPPPPTSQQKRHLQHNNNDDQTYHERAGIYSYHCLNSDTHHQFANIRATTLSMSCGLLSQRFYGDVFISRLGYFMDAGLGYPIMMNKSIELDEIKFAAYVSPDLRTDVISTLIQERNEAENEEENKNEKDEKLKETQIVQFPQWIVDASKSNYEDSASLAFLAAAMNRQQKQETIEEEEDADDDDDEGLDDNLNIKKSGNQLSIDNVKDKDKKKVSSVVVRTTLCLHCRQPCQSLCPNCEGMYFCPSPKSCQENGWSHLCLCDTWRIYTKRRDQLSTFPFTWHSELISRECQLSDEPYESFLKNKWGVISHDDDSDDDEETIKTWWETEKSGWKGGSSSSAKQIQLFNRVSYKDGFALREDLIPPESHVHDHDTSTTTQHQQYRRDEFTNLIDLHSWEDYYNLRGLPLESPIALLCTFPLTLYYAVQEYGKAPIIVSKMLNRPLRIHVVGVEKELNFLDLFKEFGFLLPENTNVELVFICREDMVPKQCNNDLNSIHNERGMKVNLTSNLTLYVQPGTFGDTLDPQFDCGSGPPDMVIAFNAGLYAYESWRTVIQYLNENKNVVGVMTDYNEHSAMNCASLGCGNSRESLKVNPFRQPRAMPVYSMNLPQFSNGFMYVFNEQELDM